MDSHAPHTTDSVKKMLEDEYGFIVVVFLGAATSVGQPLRVSLMKPFKVRARIYLWYTHARSSIDLRTQLQIKVTHIDIIFQGLLLS